MRSQFVLFVAFAVVGCALSAAVENAPKSLDDASLSSSPERRNDLLVTAEQPQPEADGFAADDNSDLDSSATHYRGYRRAYYGGYGGYPSYGGYGGYGGYPYGGYGGYGGYGHGYGHRYGGYYGGGYPSYYGGYGHRGYGGYRHGYY